MAGQDVYLNVYRLHGSPEWCSPCGLYHTGVQVGSFEYCFGEGAGIICSPVNPRISGEHNFSDGTYEYSIFMGKCHLASQDLQSTIRSFEQHYPGTSYDLVKRNCNHFSDNFLKALIGKGIPPYINRASRYGRWLSCLIPDRLLGPRQQAPEGLGGEPRATGVCGLFCGSGRRLSENEDDGALKRLGVWAYREFCKITDSLFGNKENMVRNGDMPSDIANRRALLEGAALARIERQLSSYRDTRM